MRSVAPYGACNECGCALHECECASRKLAQFEEKLEKFLNSIVTEADGYRCFDRLCVHGTYMVKNEVWQEAWPSFSEDRKAFMKRAQELGKPSPSLNLCLGCLELRLKRHLTIDDFTDVPANKSVFFGFEMYRRSTNPPAGG